MQYPHITTSNTATVLFNGIPRTIDNKHPNYQRVLSVLTHDEVIGANELLALMLPMEHVKYVLKNKNTEFTFLGNKVVCKVKGVTLELPSVLVKEISRIYQANGDLTPLFNFVKKLSKNPYPRAVDELYSFIAACGLTITEDGNFLAYKSVRADYLDHHTGTMDNSPGSLVEMPPSKVNPDKHTTCSHGLHFAAWDYAKDFGYGTPKVVLLEINPKHVVAIPSDYGNQKGRAWKYKVLRDITKNAELDNISVFTK